MMKIQSNVSLLPYNTFHIDVQAAYFVEIFSMEELQELFQHPIFQSEKKLILGGGSNMLFTGNFEGLVIKMSIKGIEEVQDISQLTQFGGVHSGEGQIFVKVAAGEHWSDFVDYANHQGRAGIENLVAIPGNVGTAPVSNIGAYGVEAKDRIAWVEGYDMQTGDFNVFTKEECGFVYRSSIFKSTLRGQFLISHVVFALEVFDEHYPFITTYPDIQQVLAGDTVPLSLVRMSEIIATIRAEKLPDWNVIGTAGSFFANPFVCIQHFKALQEKYPEIPFWEVDSSLQPAVSAQNDEGCTKEVVKLSAGRLIEKAGLKGYSNGKAGTSPNHSLIVINQGGTAQDVLEVVEHIQTTVKERFGVDLKPEVVIV